MIMSLVIKMLMRKMLVIKMLMRRRRKGRFSLTVVIISMMMTETHENSGDD